MKNDLCLGFKITNWCNLNCVHCCECSNSNEMPAFMPLDKMERYLYESRKTSVQFNELITISGGEALAPYMHNMSGYIPDALNLTYKYDYVPVLKTNATWGDNGVMRKKILSDLAECAYKSGKVATLDISLDEFHNNVDAVTKIVCEVITDSELCPAIRLCFVGFNTPKSAVVRNTLKRKLIRYGIQIRTELNGDWIAYPPDVFGMLGVYMVNSFDTPIYNRGRAVDNNVFTSTANPNGNDTTNCLQLDNKDMAIYNYTFAEPIKNRPLEEVVKILSRRARRSR